MTRLSCIGAEQEKRCCCFDEVSCRCFRICRFVSIVDSRYLCLSCPCTQDQITLNKMGLRFLSRRKSRSAIYDTRTFSFRRHFRIPESSSSSSLAFPLNLACRTSNLVIRRRSRNWKGKFLKGLGVRGKVAKSWNHSKSMVLLPFSVPPSSSLELQDVIILTSLVLFEQGFSSCSHSRFILRSTLGSDRFL